MRPRRPRGRIGRHPSCSWAGGFTLAEVVVVLAFIGIAMAMVLPRFDRTRMNLDAQEQNLRGALIMAQRLAVTRGCDVVVAFDAGNTSVRVQEDPDGDLVSDPGETDRWTALEGDVQFARGAAPPLDGVTADIGFSARQSGRPAFVFHRDGSASEHSLFYLTSGRGFDSRHANDARAFEVQRATGRFVTWHYDGASWRRESR